MTNLSFANEDLECLELGERDLIGLNLEDFLDPLSIEKILPATCIEVLTAPSGTTARIGQMVAQDPALSSAVLEAIGAPPPHSGGKTCSVSEAVVLLGEYGLRKIALGVGAGRICEQLRSDSQEAVRIRYASVYCGLFAYELARQTQHPFPERLLAAGMLHEFGQVLLLQHDPESIREIRRRMKNRGLTRSQIERQVLGFTYAELGGAVLRGYGLATDIADAIAFHLAPDDAKSSAREAALLHLAFMALKACDRSSETDSIVAMVRKTAAGSAWVRGGIDENILATTINHVDEEVIEVFVAIAPGGAEMY